MKDDAATWWTNRSRLRNVQYRTDVNLAARQSIYAYQHPLINLPAAVLDLAALSGDETVTDVGCGNGAYLSELASRQHAGRLLALDLSAGMLGAVRGRVPHAILIAADAAALPLPDGASDIALAAHMLYHVPDPRAAMRELRRITRDGGQVLVVLNGDKHLRELREAVTAVLSGLSTTGRATFDEPVHLDNGAEMLASVFRSVTRYEFAAELLVPNPGPVEDYVRSMAVTQDLPDPEPFVAAVTEYLSHRNGGAFRIQTHCGCLVCT